MSEREKSLGEPELLEALYEELGVRVMAWEDELTFAEVQPHWERAMVFGRGAWILREEKE